MSFVVSLLSETSLDKQAFEVGEGGGSDLSSGIFRPSFEGQQCSMTQVEVLFLKKDGSNLCHHFLISIKSLRARTTVAAKVFVRGSF